MVNNHEYYYIFRSGELFLLKNSTLPARIPDEFAGDAVDTLDCALGGADSRIVLLADKVSRQDAIKASVSDGAPAVAEPSVDGSWIRLRHIMASEDPAIAAIAPLATRALGLVNWHHATRFCGRCGAPLADHPKEIARVCTGCSVVSYPRISPAIIVLVEKDGKILLARHSARNQDVFSCLAGFLEHGETLEQCVEREVFEETRLKIRNIRYVGSQSWPFPDQFMLAFLAEWESGDIVVDPAEIIEARWFDRNALPSTPMPGTVAWNLINGVFKK
jgi:NADH pyrophosphatase NudC (nudix superfamily)